MNGSNCSIVICKWVGGWWCGASASVSESESISVSVGGVTWNDGSGGNGGVGMCRYECKLAWK